MNEEHDMDDATKTVNDGNGHTRRVPEWGDVEFVPTRPRHSLWRKIVTSRPVRNIAEHVQGEKRSMPSWVPGVVAMLGLALLTQGGYLIYKLSHYDTMEQQFNERLEDVYLDLRAQDQYNQLVTIYENRVQQLLIEKAGMKPNELPAVPVRPTLGKPHPKSKGE